MGEMCQLTKANSIEGCKASQVDIVYTPYLNLKKSERMDTGSVGFKDESFRLLLKHIEEDKELEERGRRKKFNEEQKLQEKEDAKKHLEEKELKSYASLQELDKGKTNLDASKTHSV